MPTMQLLFVSDACLSVPDQRAIWGDNTVLEGLQEDTYSKVIIDEIVRSQRICSGTASTAGMYWKYQSWLVAGFSSLHYSSSSIM